MRALKRLLIQVAVSALWPGYLGLLAFCARVGPWPRSLARPMAFTLVVMGYALFVAALARFLFGPGGWAEVTLRMPVTAARQVRRSIWFLVAGMLAMLLPGWILEKGLITAGDRPVNAPAICRCLLLGFEVLVLGVTYRLARTRSPLMEWLKEIGPSSWVSKHHRRLGRTLFGVVALILALDVMGYGFTARRVSTAATEMVLLALLGSLVYWLLLQAIHQHAWRWVRWGDAAHPSSSTESTHDLPARLKTLARWSVTIVTAMLAAYFWNMDLALVKTIAAQPISAHGGVTVGDAASALAAASLSLAVWRYLGAFFAVAVFPRVADDPGIRFAILTLGRYAVLGVGVITTMSCLHLGMDRIGVGLAALGVGLGFGLQEIVSNFVSGIILLLERPIRVGDIVTVTGMSGKVERINIRATTIINGENQCLIVPNREFITSNLVNWTHQDRVIRITIPVGAAYGSDPEMVADLLLAVARGEQEVLPNPVPSATMEGFGDSALMFNLYIYVADPIVIRPVKHRICTEIQKQFRTHGINIPYPTRELLTRTVQAKSDEPYLIPRNENGRVDSSHENPPRPNLTRPATSDPRPAAPSHRGMDE